MRFSLFVVVLFGLSTLGAQVSQAQARVTPSSEAARLVGQFFQEVRFGYYNTFHRWCREGVFEGDQPGAYEKLMVAREAVRLERAIPAHLQLIEEHGHPYRFTDFFEEPNAQYATAAFLVRRRASAGGQMYYTLHFIGFMMVLNEENDVWQLWDYRMMPPQVLTEELAREYGFL